MRKAKEKRPAGKALVHRQALSTEGLDIYGQICAAGVLDWLFYTVDQEEVGVTEVCGILERDHGIVVRPNSLYCMMLRKRNAYRAEMAARQRLEDGGGGDVMDEASRILNQRILTTLALEKDLSPKELAELGRLELARDTLKIREQEAKVTLYKVQMQGAEFVVEVLREQGKAEELRRMMENRTLTDAQRIEEARRIMYGEDAVSKPAAIPDMKRKGDLPLEILP